MSVKITFVNFTTKEPYPLDNPTKDNALEQATAVSIANPDYIYLLNIVYFANGQDTAEEWRLRAGKVIFHIIVPDPNKPVPHTLI
jgi:hypothetical protein